MIMLDQTLSSELSIRKTHEEVNHEDTTILCNKSLIKHTTIRLQQKHTVIEQRQKHEKTMKNLYRCEINNFIEKEDSDYGGKRIK